MSTDRTGSRDAEFDAILHGGLFEPVFQPIREIENLGGLATNRAGADLIVGLSRHMGL